MSTNLNDVHGIIYDKFNQPIPGVTVSVFDKDLRKEQLLAQSQTNPDGSYKINYDFSKYADAEHKSADVFLRIFDPTGKMIGQSDVAFNVPPEFALNFKIDNTPFRGISEFDDLVDGINPLLQNQEVRIAGLQENDKFKDISFLSGETGQSFEKISFLQIAFSLAEQTKIPADIYYGLFRMSFPTDLNALFHVSNESLLKGLQAAIEANIISSKWDDKLDKVLKDLNTLSTNYFLTTNEEQDTKFKKIISQALPSTDLQVTFVNTYFSTEATPDTFWTVLATQPGFTDGKAIQEMTTLLSINHLTGHETSLTSLLYNESRTDVELKDARGFAKFTNKDWVDRISNLVATGQLTTFPDGVEGKTLEEKTANYATIITDLIQAIYPASVFFNRLKNDTANPFGDSKTDLITFLKNNPDFDLSTNKPDSLFDKSKLDGLNNKEAAKTEIKKINRLYKLSANYEDVRALRNLGLASATDIVQQYTVDQLVQKLSPASISKEEVTTIYEKSVELDKRSTALVLAYRMRHDVPIYAITGDESIPSDFQSMFKDNSLCDCEQCQSVYSPSAYFVDILNFLRKNNGGVAFTKLIERRPDLDDILLTCNNTNIPLPYIDLVNELLESVVANQTTVAYQTESTAEELAAYPQNVLTAAYDKLKVSSAQYQLPLDLPLETSRKVLDKLDLKRQSIMELFFPNGNSTVYTDIEIAKEVLGLSNGDVGILNGSVAITGISGGAAMTTVLQESQLSYIELLQVLESYFVNPLKNDGTRTLQIVSTDADDLTTCDIEKLNLSGIDQTGLKKLVRFVRLQKKLGWNVFDVDRLLNAFNINSFDLTPSDFNTKVILKVSDAERFKRRYNIPVERMLGIFSSIGTKIYVDHALDGQPAIPSLYDELFRNKAVSNPIDPAFKPQGVALTGTITDHLPVILSALNISPEEFNLLMKGNGGSIAAIADVLALENISELYRRAFFARLVKLTIQEFFDVVTIVGINPLQDSDHLEQTFLFLDELDFIRKGTIRLNELNYLLLDAVNDPNLIPSIETVAGKLDPVRSALKKFSAEVVSDDLISDPNIRSSAESIVIDKLSSAVRADHATTRVMLNETVKFAGDPTKSYLEAFLLPAFFNNTAPLFTLDDSKNAVPSLPDYFTSYYHAYKISFLVKKLKLSADELSFFTANAAGLSIEALLNNTVPVPYDSFVDLSTLIRVRNIWKLPSDHLMEVLNIALQNEPNGKNNFIIALSNATESDQATLAFLLGDPTDISKKGILNFEFPADYSNGKNLLQLMACIAVSQKAGVDIAAFISAVQINDGTFLTGLLKSKYADDKWIETIEPISDLLRTVKRDALVAYVLNDPTMQTFRVNSHISDVNSLYEYLLIDTEMDSCMLTSRIKQGISSVQLYIDRCLMKLEDGVLLDQDFVTQWNAWRKQYRVWEANRKIFLYPENWIEPELRDDKSPFFQELESKLRQNEVTEDIADDVLYAYLEKLDTVANLEIIGVFDDELTNIVHVFGRTKAVPHQYFYRYQETGVWTAWEKVGVDPEGDYVLPVVWNNRLMLMWAVFQEKQEETSGITINPGQSIPQPDKFFEVKLAWTEYKNGKWGTKKVSKEVIKTPVTTVIKLYQLESRIVDGKLIINLFFWLPLNNTDGFFDNLGSGAFIFDGCNSSPSVHTIGFHDSLNQTLFTAPDLSSNLMFLTENAASDQKFQLFDTGVFRLSSSKGLRDIFLSSTAKATVLSNHHEIERDRREKFFFGNRVNNFFVQSSAFFKKDFFDNVLVNSTGVLVARKEIVPQDKTFTPGVALTTLNSNGSAFTANGNGSALNVKLIANPFIIFFGKRYLFQSFYHPYVCSLIKTFNTQGVDGLYVEDIQNRADAPIFSPANYNPTAMVSAPYPLEKFEFDFAGIYSIYNWELFFHIPLLIATRLSQNQKFEDARKWFHYIFDPTKSATDPNEGPERFWIPKPFKNEIRNGILSIQDILDETKNPDLQTQLNYWAANPFNPHAVARMRISAYMRSTVMKYIDNLIAWGDNLFQRDTIESINEATLLYILAANILGKKPEKVPARAIPKENSFSTIEDMLDFFSNAKVEVQSFISPSSGGDSTTDHAVMMPMFGIPKNDELLAYWDTVGDRLYKIRHCMNIEGVVRQLALFEPPLDPGLLVKAAALGLDLNSIMNDATVSLPHYRFRFMLQKAFELCNDVKTLGTELQSALEKGDAEQLSLLRSTQEVSLLEAIRDVKGAQVDEANEMLDSLNGSKAVAENRRDYYAGRTYKNASEDTYFSSSGKASRIQEGLAVENILSSILNIIPNFKIGSGFTIGTTFGGTNLGRASAAAINSSQSIISFLRMEAEMANIKGTYDRRQDDWTFQANNADLEVKQLDKQIAASEIRVAIAQTELDNHDLQIENSSKVNDFMQSKFTNTELYDFMVGQISSVYFQAYQVAYQVAKKAEKCFQQELGVEGTTYIQFGYWDSLRKGLLSGHKLQSDLRRLENAYVEQNRREFEITKHVSLATINANAILDIRKNGVCTVQLPELLFEMDFPGHYFRRIKSIGLTIPCIAGPYTAVSSQLTLNKSYVRTKDENGDEIFDFASPSSTFKLASTVVKATATSNGQADTGMFELNFNDERYFPFEGAGVISEWNIELPTEARQFDYNSISDIIITFRYTARDSSDPAFKQAVNTKIKESIEEVVAALNNNGGLFKLLSMKNDFPDVFYQMKADNSTSPTTKELKINKSFFPFFTNKYDVLFKNCRFFNKDGTPVTFAIHATNADSEVIDDSWKLVLNYNPVDIKAVDDIYLIIAYTLTS